MSLTKCKECGKEISTDAKACPNCGKKQNKIGCFSIFFMIVGIFLIIVIVSSFIGKRDGERGSITSVANIEKEENDIQTMRDTGLLTNINPELNEAYVDPIIWSGLDYQTKENVGKIMAFYCGRKKGTNLNWVDIKDNYSGKRLAKYSATFGFKVY